MDVATRAALRSIISGLRKSGAISAPHIQSVIDQLEADEPHAKANDFTVRYEIRQLCMDIASDAGLDTSIKDPDPTKG